MGEILQGPVSGWNQKERGREGRERKGKGWL